MALRIVRICTKTETRDLRLKELKELLLSRGYRAGLINNAINKAKQISRTEALIKKMNQDNERRPVFVIQYDPRLPSITSIVRRHWRTMASQDPYLKETFPQPPLVAYKVAPNLRAKLVRSKVPPTPAPRPSRVVPGMKKCAKNKCPSCPYVQPGKTFKATATNFTVQLNTKMDCDTRNLCYAITCSVANCKQQYIGQTHRSLKERFREHLRYVDIDREATGKHFNLPGHSKSDMTVTVLEKVHSRDVWLREEKESDFIRNCNSFYKGMNKKI